MITDLFWLAILLCFFAFGLTRPHVALASVIWTDVLKPQDLSFSFLAGKPLSLIVTVFFLISMLINFKKIKRPTNLSPTIILLFFIFWITICNYYALFPIPAWFKYDFVIKTLVFCLFIPFVIQEKKHLEVVIGIFVASLSYYILTAGFRSILGSGGYGVQLVYTRAGDSGAAETSTLSMLSVMIIPLIFYLIKYGESVKPNKIIKWILIITVLCGVASMVGTRARTGLVGFIALLAFFTYHYKHKMRIILALMLVAPLVYVNLPDDYVSRMNTIKSANDESSALGRIVVWRWTIDFAKERPIFGGGFSSYMANAGQLGKYLDEGVWIDERGSTGKAFHSIYFETLGETGYVGLMTYLYIIFMIWRLNLKSKRQSSEPSVQSLAVALNLCLIVYCACGAFIGIAFAPWLYYILGFSSALMTISSAKATQLTVRPPLSS